MTIDRYGRIVRMSDTGAGSGGAAPPPAAPPPAAPPPGDPWYKGVAGVDDVMIGHWQNRGLSGKTPAEVAIAMTQAHRDAEKHIGVPADQLLRLPKDPSDEATANALWSKLGRPADSKGYDFSAVKFSDGETLGDSILAALGEEAFKLNLPKDAATGIAQFLVKTLEGAEAADKSEAAAKLAEEQTALKSNWGANFDANLFVAKNTALNLGVTPEQVAALESAVGYAKVMEMFRSIGMKIGEGRYVDGGNNGNNGIMTREQASARKAELMRDTAWANRYLSGSAPERREMDALNRLIVGASQ